MSKLVRQVNTFILFLVLISIVFIISFGNLFIRKVYEDTEHNSSKFIDQFSESVSLTINRYFSVIEQTAKNDDIITFDVKKQEKVLDEIINIYPNIQSLYIFNSDGFETTSTLKNNQEKNIINFKEEPWFKKMVKLQEPLIFEGCDLKDCNFETLSILFPIHSKGVMVGILGMNIDLNVIFESINDFERENLSNVIIIDSTGTAIASLNQDEEVFYIFNESKTSEPIKGEDSELDNFELENAHLIEKPIDSHDTEVEEFNEVTSQENNSISYNNDFLKSSMSLYRQISIPGVADPWSVVVLDNSEKVLNYPYFILSLLIILVFILFLGTLYVNKKVLWPILEIDKNIENISQGNLNIINKTNKKNEIGVLADKVNKMVYSLKEHQEKEVQSKKMASLGELVSGVAHEVNTPLGICVTTSSFLSKKNNLFREKLYDGKLDKRDMIEFLRTINESLEILEHNLMRASELISSFKQLSVNQTNDEKRNFNIRENIDIVVSSLKYKITDKKYQINIKCDSEYYIDSYPRLFSQLITNLIMNALFHGFDGVESGTVDIDVSSNKDFYIIKVKDNGVGIPIEYLDKIYDPFFTTKRDKGGTGLGLNIVYNMVISIFKGNISVASTLGKGTEFKVELPKKLIETKGG